MNKPSELIKKCLTVFPWLIVGTLNWLGKYKDGIAVIGLAFGAWWTADTWHDQRERELMKPIFEQHIKLTNEVFDAVRIMATSKNSDIVKEASSKFWSIYFGPARQYLTHESLDSLGKIARVINDCVDKNIDPKEQLDCPSDIRNLTFGFASEARGDLSHRLVSIGLAEFSKSPYLPRNLR